MKMKLAFLILVKVINLNNGTFFLRNKGMRKQKARSDRVHKNSMEEWELRLNGSKIRKQWKSAVDRIIEKKELKLKNVDIAKEKSCCDEMMKFQTNIRQWPEENRASLKKLSHIEKLKVERPKSLDRGNNFTHVSLGIPKKYQYYSKEDILAADDENSDELDREVSAITSSLGKETKSCKSQFFVSVSRTMGWPAGSGRFLLICFLKKYY